MFINLLQETLPHSWLRFIKRTIQKQSVQQWKKLGKPVPPPHQIKVEAIKSLAEQYNTKVFIETGTYMGDMVSEVAPLFETLYTIELSPTYYQRATRIFKNNPNIHCLNGDSGKVIQNLLKKNITTFALFWLDAHYSGGKTARSELDSPIVMELTHIAEHSIKGHVILIDDARLFTGKDGYPELKALKRFVSQHFPTHDFRVYDDMIHIIPKKRKS